MTQKSVPRLVQRKLPCKFLTPSLRDPPRSVHKPQHRDDILAVTGTSAQFSNQATLGHCTKLDSSTPTPMTMSFGNVSPHCFAA